MNLNNKVSSSAKNVLKKNKEKRKEWNKKEKKDLDFRIAQAQVDFQLSLMTQVQSLGPTWLEERTDSCKLSPDLHMCAIPYTDPRPHKHTR